MIGVDDDFFVFRYVAPLSWWTMKKMRPMMLRTQRSRDTSVLNNWSRPVAWPTSEEERKTLEKHDNCRLMSAWYWPLTTPTWDWLIMICDVSSDPWPTHRRPETHLRQMVHSHVSSWEKYLVKEEKIFHDFTSVREIVRVSNKNSTILLTVTALIVPGIHVSADNQEQTRDYRDDRDTCRGSRRPDQW